MESKRPNIRIPKVTPDDNRGSIRIRFRLTGKDYCLTGLGRYDDPLCLANAEKLCQTIKMDILTGNFDCSLEKYRPKLDTPQNVLPITSSNKSLREVWEAYKEAHQYVTKKSVQKRAWKEVDRLLLKVDASVLSPENSYKLVSELLRHYAPNTLDRAFRRLSGAASWALSKGFILTNPWYNMAKTLPALPENNRAEKFFLQSEVTAILSAFSNNRFNPKYSRFEHSYYTDLVAFLFLTGCRPQDAIGLTVGQIKQSHIVFDRAISNGEVVTPKNEKSRKFPLNESIRQLLDRRMLTGKAPDALVFPGIGGDALNLGTFYRNWRVVVDSLVVAGEVRQYLPPYNLRNTAATMYSEAGIPDKTLARIMGTSTQMLEKHYKGVRDVEYIQLPEI